jgi:putative mRNA 3-end processing factor
MKRSGRLAETLAIMDCPLRAAAGNAGRLRRDRSARRGRRRFVPAGHVLGSAQIVLEHAGERIVVSGDYKRRPDPTCAPFEPVPVRHLHHRGDLRPAGLPPSGDTAGDRPAAPAAPRQSRPLRAGRRLCARQGAAVIAELRGRGHHDPIYIHGALERLCDSTRSLASARRAAARTGRAKEELKGRIVLAPPARSTTAGRGAARSDHRHGLGLDAGPPARPPAQCRAAADRLRPCRLGRADRHHRELARARSGSPTAARKR